MAKKKPKEAPKQIKRRAAQDQMNLLEPSPYQKAIQDAAEKLYEAQENRLAWGVVEDEARSTLQAVMEDQGIETYVYDGKVAKLDHGVTKVYVRKLGTEQAERREKGKRTKSAPIDDGGEAEGADEAEIN